MQEEAPQAQKTPEQLEEELKLKLQEERLKEEERRRLEEEARVKTEQDLRKLEEALKGALTGLAKTANSRSIAYNRLVLAQKQLERLFPSILRYKEIRYLDVSTNAIADLSLITELSSLVWINASKNQVNSLEIFNSEKLQNLQFLNLSSNKIKVLSSIALPSLKRLNLSENQIAEISWAGHNYIEILELRKNKLRKLKGIHKMKNLKQLYVCQNELTDIRGLQGLPNLQKLSVRNNKLKAIYSPFPYLPSLNYLNLRENQIAKFEELKKIGFHVTGINLLQNPITEEHGQNLKKELIYVLPHLTKINKSEVTVEERVAFEKELLQKLAQKQKERLLQQQEARKAAEEAKVQA